MSEQQDPFKQSVYEYRQSTKALFKAQEAYNVHHPVSNENIFTQKEIDYGLRETYMFMSVVVIPIQK